MKRWLYLIGSICMFVGMQAALFYAAMAKLPSGSAAARFMSGYEMHFVAFFLTTFFLSVVLSHEFVDFRWPFLGSLAYSVFVSISVEFMQRIFTSYRVFDVYDMAAGIAGALSYVVMAKIIIRYFEPMIDMAKKITK